MNLDILAATGVFILMVSLLLYLTLRYVTQLPVISKVSEHREKAKDIFEKVVESEGSPTDWESEGIPSEIGVEKKLYRISILVEDTSGKNRVNEIVKVSLRFDEKCEAKARNNTVRILDKDFKEIPFRFVSQNFCNGNYLRNATLVFKVNVSANSKKKVFVYFSNDEKIPPANYTWDLVLYLPFDEGSGTTAWDYSGNNNTGTLYNGSVICSGGDCPNWVDGKFGKAIKFDGVNDYVEVDDINFGESITFSFWFKPAENYYDKPTGWYGGVGAYGWWTGPGIGWQGWGDTWSLQVENGTDYSSITPGSFYMDKDKWYYIVGVVNGIVGEIWINGVLVKSGNFDFKQTPRINSKLRIATFYRGGDLNGTIDEVFIYNRALTQEEIVSHNATQLKVKVFPQEQVDLLSPSKLNALKTIAYPQAKNILGEDYEFRVEVNPVGS